MKSATDDIAEELRLLADCRKGDTHAFEQLVLRHQHSLYTVAYRISGSHADAAEIVQDTFLLAWRKISEFRGESRIATWLTSIAINLSRTRWQQNHKQIQREESLDSTPEHGEPEALQFASVQNSAFEQLERAQLLAVLERCIQALDHGFREVLVLRDMREMSYDEVAQAVGLREGTVKSRLFRAREAVRDCVAKAWGRI